MRVMPSGRKTFVVKYRARSGRQRWLKLGAYGPLTVERARELAKIELSKVVEGKDPASDRSQHREAVTVAQLCDLYMEAANAGLVLGRKGLPKRRQAHSRRISHVLMHISNLCSGNLKLAR